MAEAVYFLCTLLSFGCTYLLHRAYLDTGMPLLFWSAVCFVGFAFNNIFLLADLILEPQIDFAVARNLSALIGVTLLLYGLLWTRMPPSPPHDLDEQW